MIKLDDEPEPVSSAPPHARPARLCQISHSHLYVATPERLALEKLIYAADLRAGQIRFKHQDQMYSEAEVRADAWGNLCLHDKCLPAQLSSRLQPDTGESPLSNPLHSLVCLLLSIENYFRPIHSAWPKKCAGHRGRDVRPASRLLLACATRPKSDGWPSRMAARCSVCVFVRPDVCSKRLIRESHY